MINIITDYNIMQDNFEMITCLILDVFMYLYFWCLKDENRVALEEHSPDMTEVALTETNSSVSNDSPRQVNDNRLVALSNFVCDVCNRPCLSAAGLGSHRRVHRLWFPAPVESE